MDGCVLLWGKPPPDDPVVVVSSPKMSFLGKSPPCDTLAS